MLISTRAEDDYADLVATSPAVGFLSKSHLSGSALRELLSGDDARDGAEEAEPGFARAGLSTPPVAKRSPCLPTVEDFDFAVRVNLRGVFLSMEYEIPAMLDSGGAIVNMSSTAGLRGVEGIAGYVAAKHGIIGLTKAAALDYGKHGIRVNAVAPVQSLPIGSRSSTRRSGIRSAPTSL